MQTVTNDVALTDSELSAEMEWIRFREQTLGPSAYSEDPASKLIRKIKENPFVPIGEWISYLKYILKSWGPDMLFIIFYFQEPWPL